MGGNACSDEPLDEFLDLAAPVKPVEAEPTAGAGARYCWEPFGAEAPLMEGTSCVDRGCAGICTGRVSNDTVWKPALLLSLPLSFFLVLPSQFSRML